MLKTRAVSPNESSNEKVNKTIDELTKRKDLDYCFDFNVLNGNNETNGLSIISLVINEAKLTKIELVRLDHWRMAHRTSKRENASWNNANAAKWLSTNHSIRKMQILMVPLCRRESRIGGCMLTDMAGKTRWETRLTKGQLEDMYLFVPSQGK